MITIGERKTFSSNRASGGLTCSFKNIPRDKKASWGNRFIRDHNDLNYDANPESINKRIKKSAKNTRVIVEELEDLSPINKY